MRSQALIAVQRKLFHLALLRDILTVTEDGTVTIADVDNQLSRKIASHVVNQLGKPRTAKKPAGQQLGTRFEHAVSDFIEATFLALGHVRPGRWRIARTSAMKKLASYEQYSHLKELALYAKDRRELAVLLGNDYLIAGDIFLARLPEPDEEINSDGLLVDSTVSLAAPLREVVSSMAMLHASISCKFTIRTDRAQNSRSEALNLIRNRKGRVPHIVAVTAEPLPSRVSSLALGTGDLDCVYHAALPELIAAVKECGQSEAVDMLATMTEGKRLKDISDLPLDLAI